MSLIKIRAALETALNSMSPALSTSWDGLNFTPSPGTAYQIAHLMPGRPENPSIGGSHIREVGVLQISLHYPIGSGTNTIVTRAELIRSTFTRGASFTYSGVQVDIINTPEITETRINMDRLSCNVKIFFRADIFS